jgi:hypothetical protein
VRVETKPVSYRGGLVQFVVPRHWSEEHDPDGGATFWDERPHSGTLRLSVLGAKGASCDALVAHFDKRGEFETLPNGLHCRRTERRASEDGVALAVHRWEIAVPVPPDRMRIVTFAWTVEIAHAADPANVADLRVVEAVVRQRATFSSAAGGK